MPLRQNLDMPRTFSNNSTIRNQPSWKVPNQSPTQSPNHVFTKSLLTLTLVHRVTLHFSHSYLGISHCCLLALVPAHTALPNEILIAHPNTVFWHFAMFGPHTSVSPKTCGYVLNQPCCSAYLRLAKDWIWTTVLFNHQVSRKARKHTDLQLLWS